MSNEKEVDFNTVIHDQLNSVIASQAISSELKMFDHGYMLTISIEKVEDVEE